MSTQDERNRREALTTTLRFAAGHPSLGLGYEFQSEVRAVFGTRRELVLALHELWMDPCAAGSTSSSTTRAAAASPPRSSARIAWAETAAAIRAAPALERHADEIPSAGCRAEEQLLSTGVCRRVATPTFARVFPVSAACVA